jgi:hypothetical protein
LADSPTTRDFSCGREQFAGLCQACEQVHVVQAGHENDQVVLLTVRIEIVESGVLHRDLR